MSMCLLRKLQKINMMKLARNKATIWFPEWSLFSTYYVCGWTWTFLICKLSSFHFFIFRFSIYSICWMAFSFFLCFKYDHIYDIWNSLAALKKGFEWFPHIILSLIGWDWDETIPKYLEALLAHVLFRCQSQLFRRRSKWAHTYDLSYSYVRESHVIELRCLDIH